MPRSSARAASTPACCRFSWSRGAREAIGQVKGPIVLVSEPAHRGARDGALHGGGGGSPDGSGNRPPGGRRRWSTPRVRRRSTLARYSAEHKCPLELGDVPDSCEVVSGEFWCGEIARHDRRRLAQAVWAVLARRIFLIRAPGRVTQRAAGPDHGTGPLPDSRFRRARVRPPPALRRGGSPH